MIEEHVDKDSIPFFPDHFKTEALVSAGVGALVLAIGIWGMLRPIGLGDPADPMNTPLHVKAHWYFVFLQEMLKYVPKDIGVVIPILALIVLAAWPFFDKGGDSRRARRFRVGLAVVMLTIIGVLTYFGMTS
jgi:cytochrome b6-f complex subunit 4